jgi:hypothetical protein
MQLIQLTNGTSKVEVNATSLNFVQDLTEDEWYELGVNLFKLQRGANFYLGDWFNHGIDKLGDPVGILAKRGWKGPSANALRRTAKVCKQINPQYRQLEFGFELYNRVVALEAETCLDGAMQSGDPGAVIQSHLDKKTEEKRQAASDRDGKDENATKDELRAEFYRMWPRTYHGFIKLFAAGQVEEVERLIIEWVKERASELGIQLV